MIWFALAGLGSLSPASVPAPAAPPPRNSSAIVISLPGRPDPPERDAGGGRLLRGTLRWADREGATVETDPVQALSEAALSCGVGSFKWRGLDTDHGSEMILVNDRATRHALDCIAGKVVHDFYVRVERINSGR